MFQPIDPASIESSLQLFKDDLANLSVDDIVKKHICSGPPLLLPPQLYADLRNEVATKFTIHPVEVIMVGSGKLGFSIAAGKRYRHFCDESDIDITIVSGALFDKVWENVYEYRKVAGYWPEAYKFREYLFEGWIRPDMLPPSNNFPTGNDWWEFFRGLTASSKYGPYKIRAGLFKSANFLQSYQRITVKQCKDESMGAT